MGFLCMCLACQQLLCVSLCADYLSDKQWVAAFEKPKGNPAAFTRPATTVLSPYLKFGCLSPRLFHAKLLQANGFVWINGAPSFLCLAAPRPASSTVTQ